MVSPAGRVSYWEPEVKWEGGDSWGSVIGPKMKPKTPPCNNASQRELLEVENWIYRLENEICREVAHRGVDTSFESDHVAYAASLLEGNAAL